MKKILKFLACLVVLLLVIAACLYGFGRYKTGQALALRYDVADPPISLNHDAQTMAYGARLFVAKGCADCHADRAQGKLILDAGPVMKMVGPNLTAGGVGNVLTVDEMATAIRHGVGKYGRPLLFMPSRDYQNLSDADTAAIIAYIKSLPASDNKPGVGEIRPVGHVLYAFGKLPLFPAEVIDHAPRQRRAPVAAVTVEYGKYLAQTCTGCHGTNFAGQHVPGTPPDFPDAANLTQAALKDWSRNDFQTALRTGKRPDGRVLNSFMPWPAMSKMTDDEIAALWLYLSALPPVETRAK